MASLPFRTGSPLHLVSLAVCAVLVIVFALVVRRTLALPEGAARSRRLGRLRRFVGWGCLVVWLVNSAFWAIAIPFAWERSLPLQFCNLANLLGAAAVLTGARSFKSLLYFWTTTLCIWAFLTPVLSSGPDRAEFWIFWAYHLFLPLAVVETFLIQGYRPTARDLGQACLFTIIFSGLLALLDGHFGWNYGFLGPSTPANPTLLDVLGPYPLRLIWMGLMGVALFVLAWLPWRHAAAKSGGVPPS